MKFSLLDLYHKNHNQQRIFTILKLMTIRRRTIVWFWRMISTRTHEMNTFFSLCRFLILFKLELNFPIFKEEIGEYSFDSLCYFVEKFIYSNHDEKYSRWFDTRQSFVKVSLSLSLLIKRHRILYTINVFSLPSYRYQHKMTIKKDDTGGAKILTVLDTTLCHRCCLIFLG